MIVRMEFGMRVSGAQTYNSAISEYVDKGCETTRCDSPGIVKPSTIRIRKKEVGYLNVSNFHVIPGWRILWED